MKKLDLIQKKKILKMKASVVLLSFITLTYCQVIDQNEKKPIWGYECQQSKCVKIEITENNIGTAVSFPICRQFCGSEIGTLWPKPTGATKISDMIMHIDHTSIRFVFPAHRAQEYYWKETETRFSSQLKNKLPIPGITVKKGGRNVFIKISVEDSNVRFAMNTDESYVLKVKKVGANSEVSITAKSFYGARNGVETLSQLIVYDDIRNEYQMADDIEISDSPVYKYRGVLLDTSRNFFPIDAIKRTIDGMGMVKLNTFHWHITDSHSFPLGLKSHPELSELGAYSKYKIYSPNEIEEVVKYGKTRGVRVLPEFDAPAHVGEGWQHKELLACFQYQPWSKYCVEPPCGQFDVTKDKLYDILEEIYGELYNMFDKLDLFHMGGDEVSVSCWNTSTEIQSWMLDKGWTLGHDDFIKLWAHFQTKALERFDKVSRNKSIPIILWTSKLTEPPYLDEYLDKNRYIIQIWTTGNDVQIRQLLQRDYKVILSNYDALYLDCGFGGWVQGGNNWCSPYIGWQKVYENSPSKISEEYAANILGAEATLWSEQVDEHSLDARLWPRLSALAERLWSDPTGSFRDAESRMLVHRLRLVENGIAAERLQPEWCLLNEEQCPI
jgi:hexosaminidase